MGDVYRTPLLATFQTSRCMPWATGMRLPTGKLEEKTTLLKKARNLYTLPR